MLLLRNHRYGLRLYAFALLVALGAPGSALAKNWSLLELFDTQPEEDVAAADYGQLEPSAAGVVPELPPGAKLPPGRALKPVPNENETSFFFAPDKVKALRSAITIYNANLIHRSLQEEPREQAPPSPEGLSQDYLTTLTNEAQRAAAGAQKTTREVINAARGKPKPIPKSIFVYPQFYLEFLSFHSTSSWTILVNGRRFTAAEPGKEGDDLRVLGVGAERVILQWRPANMLRIKESWDSEEKSEVVVDIDKGQVTFPLRLNQTFSSYLMQVLEGKVDPVQSLKPLPVREPLAGETIEGEEAPNISSQELDLGVPFLPEPKGNPGKAAAPGKNERKTAPGAPAVSEPVTLENAAGEDVSALDEFFPDANNEQPPQAGLNGLLTNYQSIENEQ